MKLSNPIFTRMKLSKFYVYYFFFSHRHFYYNVNDFTYNFDSPN